MTHVDSKPKPDIAKAESAIAKRAASYPEVVEEHPWGHRAFKVRGKTFLFLGASGEGLSFSVKLPVSGAAALMLPFTEPTHYGLGKSGWVTAEFTKGKDVPLPVVDEWLDESYRAIAPKKLVAALGAPSAAPAPSARKRSTKRAPKKTAKRTPKTSAASAKRRSRKSGSR